MNKPIIATNIDGFLLKHEAFTEPHKAWFDRAIRMTGDKTLEYWKGRPDYFKGVDIAMHKIMPDATPSQRIIKARQFYQDDVVSYIKEHPQTIYKNVAEHLKKLKLRYTLALITTNSNEHINQILENAGLEGIYDIVYATSLNEKPDKISLLKKFIEKFGQPKFYIAARGKDVFEECLKMKIRGIYTTWDNSDEEILKIVKRDYLKEPNELELFLDSS